MQMIVSIVADPYIHGLVEELMNNGIYVTEVASTGGFLSQGNTTLVIGIEEEKFPLLDKIFREQVGDKRQAQDLFGAHLFALNVEEGLRI